jgi:hypothetical protein
MNKITFLMILILIAGCSEKNVSVPITLYKERIESGNSITSFINSNDQNGKIAMTYCEEFRQLYEVHTGTKYICAPIAYKVFAPTIKWNLTD